MKVIVAHPGTQHSFRLAAELHRRDALSDFYTGLALPVDGLADRVRRVLPNGLRKRLANRRITGVPANRIHRRAVGELAALWRLRRNADSQQVLHVRNMSFQKSIRGSALSAASAVIAFDTAAWILSEQCTALGVPLILDQCTPHPDAKSLTYALLRQQYPAWVDGIYSRRPEVRAAEQQEHNAAARIVAASSFTRQSLIDHNVEPTKIRVNPYGVDCERFAMLPRNNSRPMRFLFVGAMTAHKGLALLIDAWRELNAVGAELWLVGAASKKVLDLLPDLTGLKYFGRVAHEEVAALMQQSDVFVFPSYCDGFGLVLLEAMACGLPVITTTATAGPDIVTRDESGWIIEPGDRAGLMEAVSYCLQHPRLVREMGQQARNTAERFTWSAYGERWIQILTEVCG